MNKIEYGSEKKVKTFLYAKNKSAITAKSNLHIGGKC